MYSFDAQDLPRGCRRDGQTSSKNCSLTCVKYITHRNGGTALALDMLAARWGATRLLTQCFTAVLHRQMHAAERRQHLLHRLSGASHPHPYSQRRPLHQLTPIGCCSETLQSCATSPPLGAFECEVL